MSLGRVGYNGWGHVSAPNPDPKLGEDKDKKNTTQIPKKEEYEKEDSSSEMSIIKKEENYMYIVKEGSTIEDEVLVGVVNIDGVPHYIGRVSSSSSPSELNPGSIETLPKNLVPNDHSNNARDHDTNGNSSPYTDSSFCSTLVNMGDETTTSTFDCIAHWPQLIIAIILYITLVYVLVKIFRNNRRAISGITKNTIHIDIHMKVFSSVCVWAVMWAINFSINWHSNSPSSTANAFASREGQVAFSIYNAFIFSLSNTLNSLILYLISSNSLGQTWVSLLRGIGVVVFIATFVTFMAFLLSTESDETNYDIYIMNLWKSEATVDGFFLFQAFFILFISRKTYRERSAIFRYCFFMIPVRSLILIGCLLTSVGQNSSGICLWELGNLLYYSFFSTVVYLSLKRDCQYWIKDAGLDADDPDEEEARDTLIIKNWTEKAVTDEGTSLGHFGALIPRHELYYRSRLQEKADSSVEVHLWRRRRVVVKFCTLDILTKENILFFRQEASIAINLDHSNVVKHYGVTMEPPRLGLVLHYCKHGDLFTNLAKLRKKLLTMTQSHDSSNVEKSCISDDFGDIVETPYSTIRVALDIAHGLQYVHQHGLLHRDVKSMNVLLDQNYKAKISDFGDALVLNHTRGTMISKSEFFKNDAGEFVGTAAYGAPELLLETGLPTIKADIYSYGIILWELCTWLEPCIHIYEFDLCQVEPNSAVRVKAMNLESPRFVQQHSTQKQFTGSRLQEISEENENGQRETKDSRMSFRKSIMIAREQLINDQKEKYVQRISMKEQERLSRSSQTDRSSISNLRSSLIGNWRGSDVTAEEKKDKDSGKNLQGKIMGMMKSINSNNSNTNPEPNSVPMLDVIDIEMNLTSPTLSSNSAKRESRGEIYKYELQSNNRAAYFVAEKNYRPPLPLGGNLVVDELVDLMHRCLYPSPEKRPAWKEIIHELEKLLHEEQENSFPVGVHSHVNIQFDDDKLIPNVDL